MVVPSTASKFQIAVGCAKMIPGSHKMSYHLQLHIRRDFTYLVNRVKQLQGVFELSTVWLRSNSILCTNRLEAYYME